MVLKENFDSHDDYVCNYCGDIMAHYVKGNKKQCGGCWRITDFN